MSRRLAHSAARRRARIGLTPLIDVVFILLVFFMLASSFLDWRAIRLAAAPAPGAGPGGGFEGAMLVGVGRETVFLAGEAVALSALEARLARRLAERPGQRILVQPGPGVAMQRLVDVLDRLEAAGIRNLALVPGGG